MDTALNQSNYILQPSDVREILSTALAKRDIKVSDEEFEQAFEEFLEMPSSFDFCNLMTRTLRLQVEEWATAFVEQRF